MKKLMVGFFVVQAVCFSGQQELHAMETASVDQSKMFDFTALSLDEKNGKLIGAVGADDLVKAEALLRDGADVNTCGQHYASIVDHYFSTNVLMIAISHHNERMVALLLTQKGIDKKACAEILGGPVYALTYAVQHALGYKKDAAAMQSLKNIIEQLLAAGFDPNGSAHAYETPLHCAARGNLVTVVKLLLKKGASVNAQNRYGDTPLHACVGISEDLCMIQVIKVLIEQGADLKLKNERGQTPADLAAFNDNGFFADILRQLEAGQSVHFDIHLPQVDGTNKLDLPVEYLE